MASDATDYQVHLAQLILRMCKLWQEMEDGGQTQATVIIQAVEVDTIQRALILHLTDLSDERAR